MVNVRNHRTSLPYTLVKIRMLIDLRPNESNHSNAKLTESIEQETPPQKLRSYFLDPLQWTSPALLRPRKQSAPMGNLLSQMLGLA